MGSGGSPIPSNGGEGAVGHGYGEGLAAAHLSDAGNHLSCIRTLHHGEPPAQGSGRVQSAQTTLQAIYLQAGEPEASLEVSAQGFSQVVDLALQMVQVGQARFETSPKACNICPAGLHRAQRSPPGALGPGLDGLAEDGTVGDHEFGGGGRRRGAAVGHVVGDGEVGLVAHAAYHGNMVTEDGPGHDFLVEGPEVFEGTAATGDDYHVAATVHVQPVQGVGNLGRGVQALHLGGGEQQAGQRIAAADDVLDVLPGRAGGGGDHAHHFRELGQGTFARFLEQAFLTQAGFQSFQFLGQGALALGQDAVDHEVGGAAGFVEAHAAVGADRLAVFQDSGAAVAPEEDAIERGSAVLEGEVGMARG